MWRFILCLMPTLAFAQVEQGPANASFEPAFDGQTRAPEIGPSRIETTVFSSGFDLQWGIAPLSDGRFLVTERGGTLQLVDTDGTRLGEVSGLPDVTMVNQGGLLDVAVGAGDVVYLTYAKPMSDGIALAAARGVLVDGMLTDVRDIFVQSPSILGGKHFGSRVVIGEGGVWITSGDRGRPQYVQDEGTTIGKVLWISDAGEVSIWSTGHRNIQGAVLVGPDLWTIEHGPRGGDELNQPQQGLNYGWPVVSYGIAYSGADIGEGIAVADGFEPPVYYWDPVITPAGMAYYPTDGAYEAWRGDLFASSLFPGGLMRLELENGRVVGEERLLADVGRIRDVEVLANGDLLVLPDTRGADILRVTPRP